MRGERPGHRVLQGGPRALEVDGTGVPATREAHHLVARISGDVAQELQLYRYPFDGGEPAPPATLSRVDPEPGHLQRLFQPPEVEFVAVVDEAHGQDHVHIRGPLVLDGGGAGQVLRNESADQDQL